MHTTTYSEVHQQDLYRETEASMLQYRMHEDFSINCWCGKVGTQKKMALESPVSTGNASSLSEWFESHSKMQETKS